jgi:ribose transport system ATP-binding protein
MTPIVSVRDLRKRYGGVIALDGLSLEVMRGTVHAIVGENGAGKSTLMKVLAGAVRPDSGQILLEGQEVTMDSPAAARRRGVGIVYQELSLFPQRSVLANLFVNREPLRRGLVSTHAMREMSREMLHRLGLHVDVDAPVGRLSIGEQQLVELARVLLEEPRLFILDEPNSALNERETERLFAVLRQLRERGSTMLYVSHRLEEIFAISDRVTVTRNGKDVSTHDRKGLTLPEVIDAMIGSHQEELFPPPLPARSVGKPEELRVEGLSGRELRDIAFTARSGEVVGLAGLEGAGVSTLVNILFGARRARSGTAVYPDGQGLPRSATEAARRAVCLVPADRRRNGLMLDQSILFNISQVVVGALKGSPWFSGGEARARAGRQIAQLRIKTRSPDTPVNHLSGGNQQKVVIGKWLEIAPRVILLDDPTRGVDVGAKREIYELIRQMSADGRIVLFSSTELPELIGLCDRILVLYRGRLVGEVAGGSVDNRTLLHLINTGEKPTQTGSALQ